MIHFVYEDTFEGFLSVIYEVFHRHQLPDQIAAASRYQPGLLAEPVRIPADSGKAERVSDGIREKISPEALKNVYYAYLSEIDGIEIAVMHYLKLGFQIGKRVEDLITDPWVMKVQHARQRVGKENQLLLGILRFRQLQGGIYYAPLETNHNILALLAPHFAARLADQNWVIHDLKRGIAAVYDQNDWALTRVDSAELTRYSEEEELYQALWQRFFRQIAIEERANPALQRRFIPARYWDLLVEQVEQKPPKPRSRRRK